MYNSIIFTILSSTLEMPCCMFYLGLKIKGLIECSEMYISIVTLSKLLPASYLLMRSHHNPH